MLTIDFGVWTLVYGRVWTSGSSKVSLYKKPKKVDILSFLLYKYMLVHGHLKPQK